LYQDHVLLLLLMIWNPRPPFGKHFFLFCRCIHQ